MNITQLQRTVVDALEDVKAQDIKVYNTSHLTSLFDRVIVASGTSNRQTKALAASVRDAVKQAGGQIVSTEGEDVGEWVLVDCGDAVVHIMQPAIREYYALEEIWGGKPVRIKLAADEAAAARKAALGLDGDAAPTPAVKKSAARKPGVKKPAARKTVTSKSAPRKTAPRKTPAAAKTSAPKTPAVRTAPRRK